MGRKKRWYMASEQEVEVLRENKKKGKVRSLLTSAGTSVLMTGPLIACNPKGGHSAWDSGANKFDSYMDYPCTTEQLTDDEVVKCCLPDGETAESEDSGESDGVAECTDEQARLDASARCCPVDDAVE
jgi:hypothetical protein